MAERASLNQVVQIGVEGVGTSGTAVAANKKLQSLSIEPNLQVEIDQFRATGNKYASLTALGKEWTESGVSGRATYTELVYPFSSVLGTAVITTSGTNGRIWTFTPSTTVDDVPRTYTVEHGSSVRADKFAYGIFTELGITFNRGSIELSGSMLGRAIQDNITLTASPTSVALIPVLPTEVSVYLDTTSAGLGTTKLLRVMNAEWSIGGRFGPVWVLDAANTGYVAHVETEPDLSLNLTVEADSNGMALLTAMRDGTTRFMRIEAVTSYFLEAAIPYKLTIDTAVKLVGTGGFSDSDGVYAVEWNFVGVHDSTWGKATTVALVNLLTAL